jgi:hypothetical protein
VRLHACARSPRSGQAHASAQTLTCALVRAPACTSCLHAYRTAQITFFAAIMCINKKREDARRLDVALCFKSKREPNGGACCGAFGGRPKERLSTVAMRWVGHMLSQKPVKAVVIVLWLALLGVGIAGTAQMRVEADVNDFIPDGSYLRCASRLQHGRLPAWSIVAALFASSRRLRLPVHFKVSHA